MFCRDASLVRDFQGMSSTQFIYVPGCLHKPANSLLVLGFVLSNAACRNSRFLHSLTLCTICWRMIPDVSVRTDILWMLIRCNLPLLLCVGHCFFPSQRACNDSLWILRQRFFRDKILIAKEDMCFALHGIIRAFWLAEHSQWTLERNHIRQVRFQEHMLC